MASCETGLGAMANGEGVYGLRRAFRVAGAGSVVSALWSVPDNVTGTIMADLYQTADIPLYERLRKSQLIQIESLRTMGLPDHPYLWAGFVATGGW